MSRGGASLVEVAVALALGGLVCAGVAGLLVEELRLSRATAERVEDAAAVRTVRHVLEAELSWTDPASDLRALGTDSVRGRWFRGGGVVCAVAAGAAFVAFRGMRDPDPAKDSVLAETADGEQAMPLIGVAAAPSGCPADSAHLQRWSLAAPPPPGTPVLVFETGTYALAAHALRYRRGAEGRQPLTAERFDTRVAGFASTPSGLRVRLRLEPPASGAVRPAPPDLLVRFLNQPPTDSTTMPPGAVGAVP